jgi:hypothetical protein
MINFQYLFASIALLSMSVSASASAETMQQKFPYSIQFTLRDGGGRLMPDTYYTVCFPSGVMATGDTDSAGRTSRYRTKGPEKVSIYLGHREASDTCAGTDTLVTGTPHRD